LILYQLPNGKVIRLTIDEYIDLTDEDISYLVSIDYGEVTSNPWTGSVLSQHGEINIIEIDNSDEDLVIPPDLFLDSSEEDLE